MAGDTRDSNSSPPPRGPPPGAIEPPEHVKTPNKIYEVFSGPGPANANALPEGSGRNTAGETKEVNLTAAVKTIHLQDFKQVHLYPCVRESLLFAIGGGFAVGGVRALWGATMWKACNWAVGSFILGGLGNYEFCQYRRTLERAHMKRAVEIIDRKKEEKEAAAKLKREERRRLKEEGDDRKEAATRKRSWKFW